MFKRYSLCLLSLAASLSLSAAPLLAQSDEKATPKAEAPATLSLDSLMMDAPKTPEPLKIDEALITPPENASVEELFSFVDELQEKLPQPKSQEELYTVVDAFSKACLRTSDLLFKMELTPEERERAVQLKVVALTTRAHIDEDAAAELDSFVNDNLKAAKTEEELVKAYQLKLQVLAASEEDSLDKINALSDEMFARAETDLQVFALEVKAQSFLTNIQRDNEIDAEVLKFIEEVIADETRDARVKEKALEMKLVANVIASEIEKEKDADQQNPAYGEEAEKLFAELIDGDYSLDLKKMVYQLRVQTLLDPSVADEKATEKAEALCEKLAKETDPELHSLGIAVKGQLLLNAAKENKDAIAPLAEYADSVYEQAKENADLRGQAIGLKIQTFRLQEDSKGLLQFVDAELASDNLPEALQTNLNQVKLSVVTEMVSQDPSTFDSFVDYINDLNKNEAFAQAVSQIYVGRFVGLLKQVAENGSNLDEYNKAVDVFKSGVSACPKSVVGLLMANQYINEIGMKNNNANLFDETFSDVLKFCKISDNEELNELAQQLETYQQQMAKQKELFEAQKAAAEKAQKEADAQKATDTKAGDAPKEEVKKTDATPAKKDAPKSAATASKSSAKNPASNSKGDSKK